jgi:hypothetical protein
MRESCVRSPGSLASRSAPNLARIRSSRSESGCAPSGPGVGGGGSGGGTIDIGDPLNADTFADQTSRHAEATIPICQLPCQLCRPESPPQDDHLCVAISDSTRRKPWAVPGLHALTRRPAMLGRTRQSRSGVVRVIVGVPGTLVGVQGQLALVWTAGGCLYGLVKPRRRLIPARRGWGFGRACPAPLLHG